MTRSVSAFARPGQGASGPIGTPCRSVACRVGGWLRRRISQAERRAPRPVGGYRPRRGQSLRDPAPSDVGPTPRTGCEDSARSRDDGGVAQAAGSCSSPLCGRTLVTVAGVVAIRTRTVRSASSSAIACRNCTVTLPYLPWGRPPDPGRGGLGRHAPGPPRGRANPVMVPRARFELARALAQRCLRPPRLPVPPPRRGSRDRGHRTSRQHAHRRCWRVPLRVVVTGQDPCSPLTHHHRWW